MDYALMLLNREIMNLTGKLAACESDGLDCGQLKNDLSGLVSAETIIRRERDGLLQYGERTEGTGWASTIR